MPFGQSGYMAMMGANVAKRVTFLVAQACGMRRQNADFLSDEIGITASQTMGTAFSIFTLDPIGFGLTSTHTAMLENDLARKRAGKDKAMKPDIDIATLNLEPIAFKACIEEVWSISEVDAVEANYRKWLQLIRDHPNELLAPTKSIDRFWHHHILDTQKYIRDCDKLFGKYIHHFPYSGVRDLEDAAAQAQRHVRTQALLGQ